jgi:Family of unknown function (DUF6263)
MKTTIILRSLPLSGKWRLSFANFLVTSLPKLGTYREGKNMKAIIMTLLMGGLLFQLGCSKSQKSGAVANNNTSAASNASGGASGPADLKIKWQSGKVYDMAMTLKQSMDLDVPNQPVHQELNLSQGLHYSPLADSDSAGQKVELKFESQNIEMTQNGQEVLNYDSTGTTPVQPDSPAAPVAAAMHAMLGVPLDFTMAADGTVEKIDGLDTLSNRITAALPSQRQRLSLQQLFDADTLKQYCSFSQVMPGHPVNVGDSWSSSHDINTQVGLMTVDATYTFKDWEQHDGHNCVHLLITGDIKTKTTTASTIGAVVNIKKGILSGDAWFDPDLGMFVESNTAQDMTFDIKTRNMQLTQHLKQNVAMSLVSVGP